MGIRTTERASEGFWKTGLNWIGLDWIRLDWKVFCDPNFLHMHNGLFVKHRRDLNVMVYTRTERTTTTVSHHPGETYRHRTARHVLWMCLCTLCAPPHQPRTMFPLPLLRVWWPANFVDPPHTDSGMRIVRRDTLDRNVGATYYRQYTGKCVLQ